MALVMASQPVRRHCAVTRAAAAVVQPRNELGRVNGIFESLYFVIILFVKRSRWRWWMKKTILMQILILD